MGKTELQFIFRPENQRLWRCVYNSRENGYFGAPGARRRQTDDCPSLDTKRLTYAALTG